MRNELWPSPAGEHTGEIASFFSGRRENPAEVLMALDESGLPIGFVELSLRRDAEGCYSGGVAYIEGWYVSPQYRRRGIGTALLRAAETWGRDQHCREIASDAEIFNEQSIAAHKAAGFAEMGRNVCFRKDL